ncbi:MAG: NAD(P)-dependent oxidoreductase [bacterium]
MKVLITGGNGFIGSRLVRTMIERGYEVVVLKRKSSDLARIKDLSNQIKFYDWENMEQLQKMFALEKVKTVVHLAAAYVKANESEAQRKEMERTNVVMAKELLEASVNAGVEAFVNTGSFFEFAASNELLSENSKKNPLNYYAKTKILFEEELEKATNDKKIKGVTIRPFSPYGPGDRRTIIYLMTKALLSQQSLKLKNSAERLSFTYIDDVIESYLAVIKHLSCQAKNRYIYEDFNIGPSQNYSVEEVGEMLKKITEEKGFIEYNQGEIKVSMCNNTKAGTILNWQPQTKILDGLKKTYEYLIREGKND